MIHFAIDVNGSITCKVFCVVLITIYDIIILSWREDD